MIRAIVTAPCVCNETLYHIQTCIHGQAFLQFPPPRIRLVPTGAGRTCGVRRCGRPAAMMGSYWAVQGSSLQQSRPVCCRLLPVQCLTCRAKSIFSWRMRTHSWSGRTLYRLQNDARLEKPYGARRDRAVCDPSRDCL